MRETPRETLSAEQQRRRRGRSIAIAVSLGALVVLFYAATMVRLGNNVVPVKPTTAGEAKRPG